MVDAEKAKQPKVKKNKNSNLPDINLKSLIFGAAAYAFFPLVATQYGIDLLMAFAAIGPLYIGYEAKSYLKAVLLGIVGATPLLYLTFAGFLGAYTPKKEQKLKRNMTLQKAPKELKMFLLSQKRKNSKTLVMLKRTLLTYSFQKAEGKNNFNFN